MIKEPYRDYACGAFRYFSLCRKKGILPETIEAAWDYTAVEMCIIEWRETDPDKLAVVEAVYMAEPDRPLQRGDIIARVRRCADELHMDDSSVYRLLKEARRRFAKLRGLRT